MATRGMRAHEPTHVVAPVRRIVLDSSELLRVVKNELVLMDRGGIPLLRILGQAYDGVNVTALEVDLGPTRFLNVRKLDKAFELRLQAAWRKAVLHADMDLDMPRVRLCVVTIIA